MCINYAAPPRLLINTSRKGRTHFFPRAATLLLIRIIGTNLELAALAQMQTLIKEIKPFYYSQLDAMFTFSRPQRTVLFVPHSTPSLRLVCPDAHTHNTRIIRSESVCALLRGVN